MCEKCFRSKIALSVKLSNLISEIRAHNQVVSDAHRIKLVTVIDDNGELVVMTTVEKVEAMVIMSLVSLPIGEKHG